MNFSKKCRRRWTKKEKQFLINFYEKMGTRYCCKKLNVSKGSITGQASYLNLKYEKKPKKDEEYRVKASQFINFESPECVYLLGFIWGDGHIKIKGKYQRYVVIEIAKDDFLDIKHVFNTTGDWPVNFLQPHKSNHKETARLDLSQRILVNFLENNDYVIKSKTNPTKILDKIPENLKVYFYRGWFDADGSVSICRKNKSKEVSFSSFYNHNWIDIENLFNKLGIKYRIYRKISSKGRSSVICMNNYNSIEKIFLFLYEKYKIDGIGLSRKYNKFIQIFEHKRSVLNKKNEILK